MSSRDHKGKIESERSPGGLTRRDFLVKATLAGTAAMVAPSMLTSPIFAATPRKGGLFRIGLNDAATSDSLNPAVMYTRMETHLSYQLRNTLVEIGPNGKLIPELAESWEGSADAKKWTFKLRKGIEFHNGKTLDAADVVYSYEIHRGEDSKSTAKELIASIQKINAVDKHTIIFELSNGDVAFPHLTSLFAFGILPDGTTDYDKGIGTGPFILQNFEPGVRALVKRNPNYWKPNGPYFDEVETLAIGDANTRGNAVMTNEVDAINFADVKTAKLLQKNPNLELLQTKGRMHYVFAMRTDTQPFNDVNVRKALKYAIDRENLLKIILRGYGSVGNDQPLNSVYSDYAPEASQIQYDPDKAKFLMKKAGMLDHTFKIHAAELTFSGAVNASELYQQHAAKAGIKIEVVREANDGYWNQVWMKKPFFTSRWSGRPTANLMLASAYASHASWNETYFKNERFDKLLVSSRLEFDKDKRTEMYLEMQQILSEEGGSVIPVFADFVDVINKRVGHGELSSEWDLDGARCAERWWFKE